MSIFKKSRDKIYIRCAAVADIDALMDIEEKAWLEGTRATRKMILARIRTFPEGFLCAIKNGRIVGFICSEIIRYKDTKRKGFTWYSLTDSGYIIESHDPAGDSLYGISLSVLPQSSKAVLARLFEGMGKLIIKKRLKRGFFGARIPRYYKFARKMTAEQYVFAKNTKGFFLDPELAIYQAVGIYPVRVIKNYFKDGESLNYGVLVTWKNPFYKVVRLFPFLAGVLSMLWKVKIYKADELEDLEE